MSVSLLFNNDYSLYSVKLFYGQEGFFFAMPLITLVVRPFQKGLVGTGFWNSLSVRVKPF